MNYISVCLLIFYSSLSFCQNYDKERSADFRRNSDSLIEIGKYEPALWALTWSNLYKPQDLRTEEYQEKYNAQKKYLDSIIDCCVTDSMKCVNRVESALYIIEKGYNKKRAYDIFLSARKFCNNSEYYKRNLLKLFNPVPPDTIWVNYDDSNYNGYEAILNRVGFKQRVLQSTGYMTQGSIYLHRDTTLYSGVVIDKRESRRKEDHPYGSFDIFHVQNGNASHQVKHTVFYDPKESSGKTSDPTRKKIMNYFDEDHYYYGIVKRNGNLRVHFYPNGDTLEKNIIKTGPPYNAYNVSYYPNGDTSHYRLQSKADTNTFSIVSKRWGQNNNLIYKSTWVREINGRQFYEEDIHFNKYGDTMSYSYTSRVYTEDIKFNKYGDTIEYWYYDQHQKLQGIQIIPLNNFEYSNNDENHYLLKVNFQNGSLQTILNKDILYLDKRFKQISKSEFIALIKEKSDVNYFEFYSYIYSLEESLNINGYFYNAIACPEKYRLTNETDKLYRKLKKMK